MTDKVQLDVALLLPDTLDVRDRCVDRLMSTLRGAPGLEDVHVSEATATEPSRLCLHFDPAVTNVATIRSRAEAAGARLTEQYQHLLLEVDGVTHARKARSVAEALRSIDGVIEADVAPGLVRVELDRRLIDTPRIMDALAERGVTVAGGGEEDHDHHHGGIFGPRTELIFAIGSGVLWVLGFLLELTIEPAEWSLTIVFIASGLLGGWFTAREARDSIRAGRFEIDFLMLVAAAGAALLGKWEEGALLLALFSLGHALEGYAMGRARRAIEALADLAPSTALVRRDGIEQEVPVETLAIGDLVLVKPNERIPADGFVVAGLSAVNQAPLTGESVPVDKVPVTDPSIAAASPDTVPAASRLFAGTINGTGQLDVQVTRTSSESALSKLAELVREAETQASPTQRFTDRFERIFVPAVIGLVVAVFVIGGLVAWPWSDAFYRSMAVLVAASPCALAIATPSAVLAAVARAGQLGVLVKGGGPLEHLGSLRAVAFDKTGTLTVGQPRLVEVRPASGVNQDELLAVAVAVERRSDHPLAAAVARDGADLLTAGTVVPEADAVTAITGRGIRATVSGETVLIGNVALFEEGDGLGGGIRQDVETMQSNGRTIMIAKAGDRFLGTIGLMDTPRPEAADAIDALRDVGVEQVIMLSGDNQQVADSIARQVGLTEAWGDLLPDDKVAAVAKLRERHGGVAMVGDGVNDAPALAHATVGIAMGAAGSDVALETADIALMGDDLSKLPDVIGLSRSANRIIRQNLLASLGIVAFLIPATLLGFVGIGPAVVFHEGSTLIVVANALRLLTYRSRPHRPVGSATAPPSTPSTENP